MQPIPIKTEPAQTCGNCTHFNDCQTATADGHEDTFDLPSGQVKPTDPACEHFEALTCWTCAQRIGEECGVKGYEVFEDSLACKEYCYAEPALTCGTCEHRIRDECFLNSMPVYETTPACHQYSGE